MKRVNDASRPRRTARKSMIGFWSWSIAIHVAFALVLWWRATPPPPAVTAVEIDYLSEDELKPAPSVVREKKKASPETAQKQIVEQEHRLNDEVDEKTRFLSAFDQKVLQQTRAERSGKFNNAVHGGKQTTIGTDGAKATRRAATAAPRAPAPGDLGSLGDLLPKYDSPSLVDRVTSENPEGDPTRTDDYLKDVKPGLQTLISTREFVYYAYYNRIKAALRSHWEPEVREKVTIVFRQGRTIAAAKDRITQVVVTLDAKGELLGVQVIGQSGIAELDHAAVESFRQAAPFPNPPRGMVDVDGTVKIRWDFVLEV